ncbi:MAG: hypothetical protein RSD88_04775 [Anaerovoracaceae bacterium]
MKDNFGKVFFRLYDKKIASGEITFSKTGMKRDDFTKICIQKDFIPDEGEVRKLCETMRLTEEEAADLLKSAGVK